MHINVTQERMHITNFTAGDAEIGIMEWPLAKEAVTMINEGKVEFCSLLRLDASMFPELPEAFDPDNIDPTKGMLVNNVKFDTGFLDDKMPRLTEETHSVNLGWLDFEEWASIHAAHILVQHQCLQFLYAKEPASRSKTLDTMLSSSLRRTKKGSLYLGITELGLPKVIGLVDGILFVAGVPLLNMAHQKDAKDSSKTIIDMCAEFQHFDVNDVTNVGGFIAVMKQGDVLTIPAGWLIATDSLEDVSITLSSTCSTKHQLVSPGFMDSYKQLIDMSQDAAPVKTQLKVGLDLLKRLVPRVSAPDFAFPPASSSTKMASEVQHERHPSPTAASPLESLQIVPHEETNQSVKREHDQAADSEEDRKAQENCSRPSTF